MADRAAGILLDTSAVVAHLRGQINIHSLITAGESLYLPLVGLGELYKGVLKSARPTRNRQALNDFLRTIALLLPDQSTAETYAKVAVALEAKGQVIPENDMWIAAVALECNMPLATRDAHFERVDGLTLIPW